MEDKRKMRLILLILVAISLSAAEYWVSPTGSDLAAGTFDAPWALLKVCPLTYSGANASVGAGDTVWMRGGTYTLATGLSFGAADSGTATNPVAWQSYPGESAIISGGQGTAASKVNALKEAGVHLADRPTDIGVTMQAALSSSR